MEANTQPKKVKLQVEISGLRSHCNDEQGMEK
jgi:hypothetical protein